MEIGQTTSVSPTKSVAERFAQYPVRPIIVSAVVRQFYCVEANEALRKAARDVGRWAGPIVRVLKNTYAATTSCSIDWEA
jgi:hypothetical protein